jgi:hypothetical protein
MMKTKKLPIRLSVPFGMLLFIVVLNQVVTAAVPGGGPVAVHKTGLSTPCPKDHFLIMAQQPDRVSNQPAIIAQNIKHIESMPFNGMFINSDAGWKVMEGAPLGYGEIEKEFAPLKNVFKKFKFNFLMVYINYPGDFWDDKAWEITAGNFAKMAKVARELGCVGVVYDNEEYSGTKWLDYGGSYKNELYSLEQTSAQVIFRGKQVMEAMVAEFPEIEVLNYHGPYLSEPNYGVPKVVYGQVDAWGRYELLGPFFVGMMQGKGKCASVIDGGEVYQYRTKQNFIHSYDVRKYEIAGEQTDSWFISREMRKDWPNNIEIAFGVYNRQWKEGYPMDVEIMKTTLANALQTTDKYVWYYTEGDNWILPGKMPEEWADAVRAARNSAAGGSNKTENN